MKSFLFAIIALYVGFVYAGCAEQTLFTMNECIKIRTTARDEFCVSKPNELAKCYCVYDSLISDCYDYCPDEPSVQAALKQLNADMSAQCAAANLDPEHIPANVYNEMQTKNDVTFTPAPQASATGAAVSTNGSTANSANTSQVTTDDDTDDAQNLKYFTSVLLVNLILALIFFNIIIYYL